MLHQRFILAGLTAVLLTSASARAADVPAAPAAPTAPAGPCKSTLSFPAYSGIVQQNPDPSCIVVGPLGEIYVGGAFTGYAYTQSNPFPISGPPLPNDSSQRVDFSNLQVFIQKPDGPFQAYVQVGAYAIPSLGAVNYGTLDQTRLLFGPVPVVFGKYVFNDNWSIQGGRLPTLIGAELPFTFQNLNISRGLLFNQENVINQGVQVNYANGPLSISAAGSDGFYSGEFNWLTGNVAYKIDDANTVTFDAGANLGRSRVSSFVTPLLQNNSSIYNLIYTYSKGPWIVTPYLQYTNVDRDVRLGIAEGASTYGGALLASYAFTDHFALAGRVEYEQQTGNRTTGVTSLLYGPGSSALSFTATPTFTFGRYLLRGEYSHVELSDIQRGDFAAGAAGSGFGRTGNKTSQDRFMVETGITF